MTDRITEAQRELSDAHAACGELAIMMLQSLSDQEIAHVFGRDVLGDWQIAANRWSVASNNALLAIRQENIDRRVQRRLDAIGI